MTKIKRMSQEKLCNRCETTKLKEEFNKDIQKKDGLRNYCRDCERIMSAEKKRKKELGIVENVITDIFNIKKKEKSNIVATKEVKTDVDSLAKIIVKDYGDNITKADDVYDTFMEKITRGDNTQASKEALTKSLELRMSSTDSIIKLIQIAAKLQETRERSKGKGNDGISIANLKDNFNIED